MDTIKFTIGDILDFSDAVSYMTGSNFHNVRPFLLHDHGFVLCVVWASCLQDALDEAVNQNKLDRFQIDPKDFGDYGDTEDEQWENMTHLGNASEPFDIESLSVVELSPAKFWEALGKVEFEAI